MGQYRINDFWAPLLRSSVQCADSPVSGWLFDSKPLPTFVEPPLDLAQEFGEQVVNRARVILISAPGAVGKSTFARQLSSQSGAPLLDLAEAEPVGANTLVGGLARCNLYGRYLSEDVSLIIDGLDEARIQVTQDGFVAFLKDAAFLASQSSRPLIMLGRTGSVVETWLILNDLGVDAAVLEIGFFAEGDSLKFTELQIANLRELPAPQDADRRAAELILNRLRASTDADSTVFAGYSPVLVAVARQISSYANPQELVSKLNSGAAAITLAEITRSILEREQGKLGNLEFQDVSLKDKLYTPSEQLKRLVAKLYSNAEAPILPEMSQSDQETYLSALDSWVGEHPFLDGKGNNPSSAVFHGLLLAAALHDDSAKQDALFDELARGTSINPFLAEFYLELANIRSEQRFVESEHVGLLYGSVRARLSLGERANLNIDNGNDDDGSPEILAEVEVTRDGKEHSQAQPVRFLTDARGTFRFGGSVEDVDLTIPDATVIFGAGEEVTFVAPVFIDCKTMEINVEKVIIEPTSTGDDPSYRSSSVQLFAREAHVARVSSRPVKRGDVSLEVSWPNSKNYPWSDFSFSREAGLDAAIGEAMSKLKRMVRLFRSHKRSQLAKYKAAIDHRRRSGGLGAKVRDQLLEEGVFTISEPMYFLDPDRLVECVGLSFQDVRSGRFTSTTVDFLKRAIDRD